MSSIKAALDELKNFQTELTQFLETVNGSISRSWTAAKPWEVELRGMKLKQAGNALEKCMKQVEKHQNIEKLVDKARKGIESRTQKIRDIGDILYQNQLALENELNSVTKLLPSTEDLSIQHKGIPLEWILQLARKMSYTSHAPSGWHCIPSRIQEDWPLPPRFFYPGPLQSDIQKGLLFKTPQELLTKRFENIKSSENGFHKEGDVVTEDDEKITTNNNKRTSSNEQQQTATSKKKVKLSISNEKETKPSTKNSQKNNKKSESEDLFDDL